MHDDEYDEGELATAARLGREVEHYLRTRGTQDDEADAAAIALLVRHARAVPPLPLRVGTAQQNLHSEAAVLINALKSIVDRLKALGPCPLDGDNALANIAERCGHVAERTRSRQGTRSGMVQIKRVVPSRRLID